MSICIIYASSQLPAISFSRMQRLLGKTNSIIIIHQSICKEYIGYQLERANWKRCLWLNSRQMAGQEGSARHLDYMGRQYKRSPVSYQLLMIKCVLRWPRSPIKISELDISVCRAQKEECWTGAGRPTTFHLQTHVTQSANPAPDAIYAVYMSSVEITLNFINSIAR